MKKIFILLSILMPFGYLFSQDILYFHAFNKTGWTPVHYAAASGNVKAISLLCKHVPVALDKKSRNDGTTALFVALLYGQTETASRLIELGASTTGLWDPSTGGSPLHLLATKNRPRLMQRLLEWNQQHDILDINDQDTAERTPLMIAAQNGDIQTLRVLLNAGANLYFIDQDGCNVLKYASFPYGRPLDIFEELTTQWQPEEDPFNATPLHYAVLIGNRKAVEIELKRDQTQKDKHSAAGATPLFIALMLGQTEIADLLADDTTCQSKNLRNNSGDSPLHTAIQMNNPGIVEAILNWINNKGNQLTWMINSCNKQSKAPLNLVLELTDQQMRSTLTRLLIRYGANIENCTRRSHPPATAQ